MPRYEEDKYREEVLNGFLTTELYPNIATEFERVSDAAAQKEGADVRIQFEWGTDTVVADEKAQNSDKWLNNPVPTFVMEIFSESWFEDGAPKRNIGWFVDTNNKTEYYVLVWLPEVSLFKLERVFDDLILSYEPAASIDFTPETILNHLNQDVDYRVQNGTYRFERSADIIEAFDTVAEPLPGILQPGRDPDFGEWYYDPVHIHEAKVAIVDKEAIKTALNDVGLTRDVLIDKAEQAMTKGKVPVNTDKAKYVLRSSGSASGSAADEDPVNLVVEYDTYHEVADQTCHYNNGTWDYGVRLF